MSATDTIRSYFDAFNAKDTEAMLACLDAEVAHHVNEGQVLTARSKTKIMPRARI